MAALPEEIAWRLSPGMMKEEKLAWGRMDVAATEMV